MKKFLCTCLVGILIVLSLIGCGTIEKTRVQDGKFTFSSDEFIHISEKLLQKHKDANISFGEMEDLSNGQMCDISIGDRKGLNYYGFLLSEEGEVESVAVMIDTSEKAQNSEDDIKFMLELFIMSCDPTLSADEADEMVHSMEKKNTDDSKFKDKNGIRYRMWESDASGYQLMAYPAQEE